MIVVDTSVWIDFFNGNSTRAVDFFRARLGHEVFAIGDLMLTETLQGFVSDKDYQKARRLLRAFPVVSVGGESVAVMAAQHYRILRKKGVTLRGAVDALIGAYCIKNGMPLLYSDRDFEPMVRHLGLRTALEGLH